MPKLHPLPAAFIIDWEGHFINIVGTPTPHFYLTDSFVSPHKFAGISSRAQDRDAYRFLVKGRNDWEAFFFHWRAGVSVEALAVPHSGCFHLGLLRLLRATSARSGGVDSSIVALARQLHIPDGLPQAQDALRSRFQRCLDKSDNAKTHAAYSKVHDDKAKLAYLSNSVYEPAMELAPKKRKGTPKSGEPPPLPPNLACGNT